MLSNDLTLRAIYDNVGAPCGVMNGAAPVSAASSNSNPDNNNSIQGAVTGEIYKMELDGTVLGKFGKTGETAGRVQHHAFDGLPASERGFDLGDHHWRVQRITLKAAYEVARGLGRNNGFEI